MDLYFGIKIFLACLVLWGVYRAWPTATEEEKVELKKKKETAGESIRSFLIAILIALVFRSIAFEPFHIPSGSMLSTLYEGDYIFVSKLSYGYSRYSFPFGFKFFDGRLFYTPPKRGDVVVFRLPPNPKIDYIKRIIGLPGDKIQVRDGRLYINDAAVEVTRRDDIEVPDDAGQSRREIRYDETLPGGVTHTILADPAMRHFMLGRFDPNNTGVYEVPQGYYFMMGDNRDHSEDSRFSEALMGDHMAPGLVPVENIIGRADLILLSYDTDVPFWHIWEWPHAFRNDRWLKSIR